MTKAETVATNFAEDKPTVYQSGGRLHFNVFPKHPWVCICVYMYMNMQICICICMCMHIDIIHTISFISASENGLSISNKASHKP